MEEVMLITGGSRGIGKAMAEYFANTYHVMIMVRKLDDELLDWADQYHIHCLVGDVTDEADVKRVFKTIKTEFNQLDVLINNAGIIKDQFLIRMKKKDFQAVIETNLTGAFLMAKEAFRMMQKTQGVIINMASVVGLVGNIGQANYVASKAGLIGLTKTIAKEGALRGIRCNAIAPGLIDTAMTQKMEQSALQHLLERVPLQRLGQVDEVVQAADFLIRNHYVTGQTIVVDGGLSLG